MKLDIVRREYTERDQLTLVNRATGKFVAQMGPFDNVFTSERIQEATELYADLEEYGLLKAVIAALDKRKGEQLK